MDKNFWDRVSKEWIIEEKKVTKPRLKPSKDTQENGPKVPTLDEIFNS